MLFRDHSAPLAQGALPSSSVSWKTRTYLVTIAGAFHRSRQLMHTSVITAGRLMDPEHGVTSEVSRPHRAFLPCISPAYPQPQMLSHSATSMSSHGKLAAHSAFRCSTRKLRSRYCFAGYVLAFSGHSVVRFQLDLRSYIRLCVLRRG